MIAMLVALLLAQAPKSSVLGKPEKPWWEMLKKGDAVRLHAPRGSFVPLIRLQEGPSQAVERGCAGKDPEEYVSFRRCEQHAPDFLRAARDGRWDRIHAMCDLDEVVRLWEGAAVRIVALQDDPILGMPLVEVSATTTSAGTQNYLVPIAYLGPPASRRHPKADRLPLLVRGGSCRDPHCARLDAVSYAEATKQGSAPRIP